MKVARGKTESIRNIKFIKCINVIYQDYIGIISDIVVLSLKKIESNYGKY